MSLATGMKRDRIFESLRRQILSGALPRGSRMPQDELARQFDASITPVREALRLLEAEGLIVSEPHRGVRVAGVDLDKVKATYITRRLVESYAMRRATSRLSQRDLARAQTLIEQMNGTKGADDLETYRHDNREFHFLFYDRCGLSGLRDQIDAMWQAFPWDLLLDTSDRTAESQQEHIDILAAVRSGDLEAVAATTELHIQKGFAGIAHRLSDRVDGDPFDIDVD